MTGLVRRTAERLLRDRVMRRRFSAKFHRAPIYVSSAGGLNTIATPAEKVAALCEWASRP